MAFTRKMLKDTGLSDEMIEKVMTMHGVAMQDYLTKDEVDKRVKEELGKQLGDANIEELRTKAAKVDDLTKQLADSTKSIADMKRDFSIDAKLTAAKAVNTKAVRALLDMSKITFEGDTLKGLDEQIETIKKDTSNAWAFVADTPPAGPAKPSAGGIRQGGPAASASADQAYLDAKYKGNKFYKGAATGAPDGGTPPTT